MVELFGVLLVITTLIMLLLPAVQSSREMARRTSCANNLLQVSMGLQAYHATFGRYPEQLSGTDGSPEPRRDNDRRLSVLVGLLPFLDKTNVHEKISRPMTTDAKAPTFRDWFLLTDDPSEDGDFQDSEAEQTIDWPGGGPAPTESRYPPWSFDLQVFRCPSDPGMGSPAMGRTNYAICLGDGVLGSDTGPFKEVDGSFLIDPDLLEQTLASMRGVFIPRMVTKQTDVTDGLSNTILLGEIATALGDQACKTFPMVANSPEQLRDNPGWIQDSDRKDPLRPNFWEQTNEDSKLFRNYGARRGYRWADGMPLYTAINTILPPNREISLAHDRDDTWGVLPPSSRHQGGAHIAMADNSVRFLTNEVEAGNENAATVYAGSPNPPGSESPYGLWGAMGTRNARELINVDGGSH